MGLLLVLNKILTIKREGGDEYMNYYYKVKLDYKTTNFWKYDINDNFIGVVEEDELKINFPENYNEIIELNGIYNNLFINNATEFSFIGFSNIKDYYNFKNSWKNLLDELRNKCKLKIIDNIEYDTLLEQNNKD